MTKRTFLVLEEPTKEEGRQVIGLPAERVNFDVFIWNFFQGIHFMRISFHVYELLALDHIHFSLLPINYPMQYSLPSHSRIAHISYSSTNYDPSPSSPSQATSTYLSIRKHHMYYHIFTHMHKVLVWSLFVSVALILCTWYWIRLFYYLSCWNLKFLASFGFFGIWVVGNIQLFLIGTILGIYSYLILTLSQFLFSFWTIIALGESQVERASDI